LPISTDVTQTGATAFYLRGGYKAKDGKIAVLARIYLNSERITLCSTGISVEPSQWDSKMGRVKGRKSDTAKANAILDRVETDLNYLFRRHEFDDNLSLDLIKSEYLGKENKKQGVIQGFLQAGDRPR